LEASEIVTRSSGRNGWLHAVRHQLDADRESERPEVVLADAGYWHQAQMEEIVSRGMQVLVPPDSRKREGARAG
jgi:hypothetical protein